MLLQRWEAKIHWEGKSPQPGSNSQPSGHESDTLTTEPPGHGVKCSVLDNTSNLSNLFFSITVEDAGVVSAMLVVQQRSTYTECCLLIQSDIVRDAPASVKKSKISSRDTLEYSMQVKDLWYRTISSFVPDIPYLILFNTILTFNNLAQETSWKHCGKRRKCW